ncbi:MAG: NTP transferase domain-containing protein [bacterium]|nr:NTP transferase domain-containing protein [bacterium]
MRLVSGHTMFEHAYSLRMGTQLPCIVVGHADGIKLNSYPDLRVIPDEIPDCGPVGALLGLLKKQSAAHYLVLACDQPLLRFELIGRLLAESDERPTVF